jgi:hypothetical protein
VQEREIAALAFPDKRGAPGAQGDADHRSGGGGGVAIGGLRARADHSRLKEKPGATARLRRFDSR